MRISDWSSDVCSSDLAHRLPAAPGADVGGRGGRRDRRVAHRPGGQRAAHAAVVDLQQRLRGLARHRRLSGTRARGAEVEAAARDFLLGQGLRTVRSEEHTSELQSLMRILYAVFCLKTKKE